MARTAKIAPADKDFCRAVAAAAFTNPFSDSFRQLTDSIVGDEQSPTLRQEAFARAIITRAEGEGRSVSIHVERDNSALALYERLGFRMREDRGVYLFMVHPAGVTPERRLDAAAPPEQVASAHHY